MSWNVLRNHYKEVLEAAVSLVSVSAIVFSILSWQQSDEANTLAREANSLAQAASRADYASDAAFADVTIEGWLTDAKAKQDESGYITFINGSRHTYTNLYVWIYGLNSRPALHYRLVDQLEGCQKANLRVPFEDPSSGADMRGEKKLLIAVSFTDSSGTLWTRMLDNNDLASSFTYKSEDLEPSTWTKNNDKASIYSFLGGQCE